MATEVERKFLVAGNEWKHHIARSVGIRQAYLSVTAALTIRVRIIDDAEAFLTLKSAAPDVSRAEFEYSIPLEDARELVDLRKGRMVEKRRHIVLCGGAKWEVDVFAGDHEGLVIAEIELSQPDALFERPQWLGEEVTGDARYYNANLAGA